MSTVNWFRQKWNNQKFLMEKPVIQRKQYFLISQQKKMRKKYEPFVKYHMNVESPFFLFKRNLTFVHETKRMKKRLAKLKWFWVRKLSAPYLMIGEIECIFLL